MLVGIKLPQDSIFLKYAQPGILLPGHPGGVNKFKLEFCTFAGIFDLGQQAHLDTKTTHKGAEHFKIIPWLRYISHPD